MLWKEQPRHAVKIRFFLQNESLGRPCSSLWGAQRSGWAPCLVAVGVGGRCTGQPGVTLVPALPPCHTTLALSTLRAAVLVFPSCCCGSSGIKQGQWVSPRSQESSISCQPHVGTRWSGSSQACLLPRVASWLLEDDSLLRAAKLQLLEASALCWHSTPEPWGCELIFESQHIPASSPPQLPIFPFSPPLKKPPPQTTMPKPPISERIAITELWKGGEGKKKKKRRNGFHGKFAGFNLSTKRRILTFFPCFRTGWMANEIVCCVLAFKGIALIYVHRDFVPVFSYFVLVIRKLLITALWRRLT